jgi:osmoprotectant transport system substrate-binding protein
MIVLMLEDHAFQVNDRTEFGTTDVVRKAIISGEIDIYPEYTGNGGFLFDRSDSSVWNNAEKACQTVKRLDLEQNDIVWLQPAFANNTWAIAVREDLAAKEGVATLEDFAEYVNSGERVKLAGSGGRSAPRPVEAERRKPGPTRRRTAS